MGGRVIITTAKAHAEARLGSLGKPRPGLVRSLPTLRKESLTGKLREVPKPVRRRPFKEQ